MGAASFWTLFFMLAGLAIVIYIIAADKKRFLVRFDLAQWQEKRYLQSLPNFLQVLHDNHFRTPWPVARNCVSVGFFRFRVGLMRRRSSAIRRPFIEQHVLLFALLDIFKPFLQDFILNEQQRIVGMRVLEMEDTADRDRLMSFLEHTRAIRSQFFHSLTRPERNTLADMVERRFIPTLKIAHAIFQEHGYSLLPEFTQLREWGELSGTDLAQELPVLPVIKSDPITSLMPRTVARQQ